MAWWAGFQVGTSLDGVSFTRLPRIVPTQLGPGWGGGEGTLFVDDDEAATAYVIFEAGVTEPSNASFTHRIHIARLSEDYTTTTSLVVELFPDSFVEAPSMFKRGGRYYATYGTIDLPNLEKESVSAENPFLGTGVPS